MTNHSAHSQRSSPAKAGSASSKTMPGKAAANEEGRKDVYQMVTDSIIAILEKGTRPWVQSWSESGGGSMPLRHCGDRYRGINVLILWGAQAAGGYQSPYRHHLQKGYGKIILPPLAENSYRRIYRRFILLAADSRR